MIQIYKKVRYKQLLAEINRLEEKVSKLSDADLKQYTDDLRERRDLGESLDSLLPEMYVLVREAAKRTVNMRHFDVQILGGIALHDRAVIEMETGEGKTLVAPLAACLHALDGKGVHVVTVNDYLVERDTKWMGPIYEALGFSVRCVLCDTPLPDRIRAYKADVTYATVREMGYDFLREAVSMDPQRESIPLNLNWLILPPTASQSDRDALCLRGRNFAIVDEADSVLIDFARAPISISEPAPGGIDPEVFRIADALARTLEKGKHFTVDEGKKEVELTEAGEAKADELFSRYRQFDLLKIDWRERVKDAIVANFLSVKDRDYIVQDNNIIIIDQITGRKMPGVRLGKHLHQALEAKERVPIRPEMQIIRQINIQRLFEPYKRLAGMTGTAWESRREFKSVYHVRVVRIPTNKPLRRYWLPDKFFRTEEEKWDAIVKDIAERHARGQPLLIGTRSIAKSELLSERLKAMNIPHNVLNARNHAKEAEIIATAGQKGNVTISTSMAGRGTDIKLGPGVVELGGLHIIGTERHELRRLDKQLGGRCGRQGDPGSVQYYASLEDDVLRVIPEKKLERLKKRYANHKGEITDGRVAKLFDKAQALFRYYFSEMRKALLEKDKRDERLSEIFLTNK